MKKVIILLLILIASINYAQNIGLSFSAGLPQGDFKESMNRTGWGLQTQVTFGEKLNWPVTIGANLGYYWYGSESRNTRISSDIPDVRVDVDRNYNLANMHLLLELKPFQEGPVVPYIDILAGGSYLFTQTSVNNEYSNEEVSSSVNFDDFAWSYGAGAGLAIKVWENDSPDGEKIKDVYIDVKARYLMGSKAEYLQPGGVRIAQGQVYYFPTESKTDLLTLHIGVSMNF